MAEPDVNVIDWMTDITSDPLKIIEPSSEKKIAGWNVEEAPPSQYFNFMWHSTGRWLSWLKELIYAGPITVGTSGARFTDLQDAIDELPVGGGVIQVITDITLTALHTLPAGTVLLGSGFGTAITLSGSGKLELAGDCQIRDIAIDTALMSTIMVETTGDYNNIYHCKLTVPGGSTSTCVKFSSDGNHVGASVLLGVASPSTGVGINDAGADNTEADNVFGS
jgi:hypothetical protein